MEKVAAANYSLDDQATRIDVSLTKNEEGFGFNIIGGIDKVHLQGDTGFFISRVRPEGVAHKDGRLSVGDRLISIDGVDLSGRTHAEAVELFKAISLGQSSNLLIEKNGEKNLLRKQKAGNMPISTPASVAETESVDENLRTPKELFSLLNPAHNSFWTEIFFVAVGTAALGTAIYFGYSFNKRR